MKHPEEHIIFYIPKFQITSPKAYQLSLDVLVKSPTLKNTAVTRLKKQANMKKMAALLGSF
jgi:hypothetical protein